jgi:hypothetical protein
VRRAGVVHTTDQNDKCRFQVGVLRDAIARQDTDLSAQQRTINTCVVALASANKPESPTITTTLGWLTSEFLKTPPPQRMTAVVATSNVDRPNIQVILECDKPFGLISFSAIGDPGTGMYSTLSVAQPTPTKVTIQRAVPAWPKQYPLLMIVVSPQDVPVSQCKVSEN